MKGVQIVSKRNKTVVIIASAVGLLAVIVCGMLIWFFSPGVHRLFGFTNVDAEQAGYIVSQDREIIDEATFSAKGCAPATSEHGVESKENAFSHIQIGDFPPITSDDKASAYTRQLNDNTLMVTVSTVETVENKARSNNFDETSLLHYRVFIDTDTNEILMSSVERVQNGETTRQYFFTTDDMDIINSTLDRCPY